MQGSVSTPSPARLADRAKPEAWPSGRRVGSTGPNHVRPLPLPGGGSDSLGAMADDTARRPPEFPPPWAVAWGDDRFGLWAELEVKTVIQRLRWIEPGWFWMGSRKGEGGHSSELPRHRVRVRDGFWLADTACTQAMWLAVLVGDSNPSRFSDDTALPVEEVSFDDVARFLLRLTVEFTEGCNAELPTEAEWEYACRAGTEAAFAFGDTINPQQVNYDGNEPYGNAAKGLYRERTVPVKALPANRWGLFQMHGNVWEWCDDYGRDYGRNDAETAVADGFVLDPAGQRGSGPEARRAVRGGSWVRIAGLARSACRASFPRGGRSRSLGFRFALRSTSQGPAEPAGPEGLQVLGLGPEGR